MNSDQPFDVNDAEGSDRLVQVSFPRNLPDRNRLLAAGQRVDVAGGGETE